MIQKRRIVLIAGVATAVLALIAVGVMWVTSSTRGLEPSAAPPTRAASPSVSAAPTDTGSTDGTDGEYAHVAAFTSELAQRAEEAAIVVSSWDGSELSHRRVDRYIAAHVAPSVAAEFESVWSRIFGSNITAEIVTEVRGVPAINKVTGPPGDRSFRVGVTIIYEGTWHGSDDKPRMQQPAAATWWLTLDEATGAITAIEQPTPDDLQIRIS